MIIIFAIFFVFFIMLGTTALIANKIFNKYTELRNKRQKVKTPTMQVFGQLSMYAHNSCKTTKKN